MLSGHGGVVIGSEMSGDVRKVTISNCVFDGTDRGIRIKATRGRGGIVEEIRVNNIVMKDIKREAITLNLFYTKVPAEPVSERTPIFRNIHVSNLTGSQVNVAGNVLGIEEMPVSNISFSNINIDAKFGFIVDQAENITFAGIQVNTEMGIPFKISNAKEIRINNIYTVNPQNDVPVIEMTDVKDAFIQGCFPLKGSQAFLKLEGKVSENIIMMNNYLERLSTPVIKGIDVKNEALMLK
jgi:polygalacturonase